MEYVMVPVPEDLVVDVMQYIARLVTRAAVVPWDKESVGDHFDEIEEAGRALLSYVARSHRRGQGRDHRRRGQRARTEPQRHP